jgi:hypothetical protein
MVLTKPAQGNINPVFITCLLSLAFWVLFCLLYSLSIYTWNTWLCSEVPLTNVISLHSTISLPDTYHWSLLISYLITQNLENSPGCLRLNCCRGFYVCKSSNLWPVTTTSVSLQMQWKYNCNITFLYVAYANTNPTRCVISSKKNFTPICYIFKLFIICPIMKESMLPSS